MAVQQRDAAADGPYVFQAAALGLELDAGRRLQVAEPKPRRPSLSQRLGLQTAAAERSASPGSEASARTPSPGTEEAGGSPKPASPVAGGPKQRAVKIECLDVAGNDVYAGTSHGQIVHFTTETPEVGSGRAAEHFRVQTVDLKLGGKRVEQVLAFPAMSRLVVLCGSAVVFYSLPELRAVASSAMPTIKGVACIAFDERVQRSTATTAVLCVARMRQISLYRIGADLKLEQEVPIESSVASICQYGNYVCLADTETYKILDLAKARAGGAREAAQLELMPTQQPRTNAATGRVVRPPRPRTLVVGPDEFMFLTPSGDDATLGVMVTATGEALRGTLQFATYPKSIVYDDPYVVATFGSGQVDVYDTRSPELTLVQTFFGDGPPDSQRRLSTVAGLRACSRIAQPEVIDVSDSITGVAGGSGSVAAASVFDPRNLPRHTGCDFEETAWTEVLGPAVHWRREALGDSGGRAPAAGVGPRGALSRWLEARVAVFSSDSVHALVRQPQLARVETLVREQRVEEAVVAVEAALTAAACPAARGDEVAYCFQLAGMVCLKNSLLDDALQHFCRGELDPRALLHLFPEYVDYLGPLLVPFGRIPMATGLRQVFYEIGAVERLVERAARQLAGDSAEQQSAVGATLQANALEMLQRYLEFCRRLMAQDDQPFAPDAIPVVDTSLARVYAATGAHDRLCSLLRRPRSAVVGDLACDYYRDARLYYYCSLVHRAQGDSARALDAWRRLLSGEWEDPRFGGLPEYLEYAAALGSQAALRDEYYWLAGFDAEASLVLLARLTDATVATVDAERVIDAIEVRGDRVLRVFIERLIAAGHARATHYVTYLAKAYVRQIRDHYLADTAEARARAAALETQYRCAQATDLSLTFRDHLRVVRRSGDEGTELRAQLLDVLCARPPRYDPRALLECIDAEAPDYLHVERAVLLVVLGQADDALDALVHRCSEYAEAELLLLRPDAPRSLARLGPLRPEEPLTARVRRLLAMYLRVADSDDDTAARLVVDVLARYSAHVDADVLDQIPAHWPYTAVEPFVRRRLQLLARDERALQVERSLATARAQADRADAVLALADHGPVPLDYSQTCAACKKLLGSASFVYMPDTRQISHVSCTKL
ncbi:hypothetical protein H4R21_000982 [Coemansia helicoidea]|uniref:Uncharacterized protein n=1 Tax=Coemansia helicoidea TaxID=1286919 RepID=A0ACC1LDV1_9FUNG|nr:hypothetical protein H4R21_000982 [Coemansia helicoidea]